MKLFVLGIASLWAAGNWTMLPVDKLEAMKQRPCTFYHVWANWCSVCMEELPKLVQTLGASKSINPVIIDISPTHVQETFSKNFLDSLHSPFVTYLKPDGDATVYMQALAGKWDGQLPFSIVFSKGKEKNRWVGSTPSVDALITEIETACR